LAIEMLKPHRLLARERVSWRHDEDQSFLPAGDGAQARAGLGISYESEVSASILDGLIDLLGLAVVDFDFDSGMGLAKLLQQGREIVKGDTDDAGDAKLASEFSARNTEACPEALIAVEDVSADLEIDTPFGSDLEGFPAAVNQGYAEVFFHGPYLLAHCALCDSARFGGAGEISRITEIAEDLESLDMHRQSLP
jgi:hypothetical protein